MTAYNVPLEKIAPNPWQTRRELVSSHVKDLATDIQANGLLQVPVGRLVLDGQPLDNWQVTDLGGWLSRDNVQVQLAFGHNRVEAFRVLKATEEDGDWSAMPVDIRPLTDEQMADYAWSENRYKPISPLERALSIQARIQHFNWSHDDVADHLQISKSAVSNALRLLKLPVELQEALHRGDISERQAVALLGLFELPEPLRAEAENHRWLDDIKPSKIIQAALDGESSDKTRERVGQIVEICAKRLNVWPLDHFFTVGGKIRSNKCSECQLRITRNGVTRCGDSACYDAKNYDWKASQLPGFAAGRDVPVTVEVTPPEPAPLPRAEVSLAGAAPVPTTTTPQPAAPAPAPSPAPAPQLEPAPEPDRPLTWDESAITVTLTWTARREGAGRQVLIGVRANGEIPVMKVMFEQDVDLSPELIQCLAQQVVTLRNQLEERTAS